MGISTFNIIMKDVIPNITSFIAINFISIMKGAIMTSVSLMILGLVPFKGKSLGHDDTNGYVSIISIIWWIWSYSLLYDSIMGIVLFQLGCYFFANGLDEAMNPRLRR